MMTVLMAAAATRSSLRDYDKPIARSRDYTLLPSAQRQHRAGMDAAILLSSLLLLISWVNADILTWEERPYDLCFTPRDPDTGGHVHSAFTIFTIAHMNNDVWMRGLRRNRLCYCQLHNCTYCEIPNRMHPNRAPSWSKIPAFLAVKHLSEYTINIDADAVIMDFEKSFLEIARANMKEETQALFTSDLHIPRGTTNGSDAICAGVFILRDDVSVRRMLTEMFETIQAVNHKWWEQQALLIYLKNHPQVLSDDTVRIIPWEVMQTRSDLYEEGDFIKHYAGPVEHKRIPELLLEFQHHSCDIFSADHANKADDSSTMTAIPGDYPVNVPKLVTDQTVSLLHSSQADPEQQHDEGREEWQLVEEEQREGREEHGKPQQQNGEEHQEDEAQHHLWEEHLEVDEQQHDKDHAHQIIEVNAQEEVGQQHLARKHRFMSTDR